MGVAFGYFIISPLAVNFFTTYQTSGQVENLPTIQSYISIITTSDLRYPLPHSYTCLPNMCPKIYFQIVHVHYQGAQ